MGWVMGRIMGYVMVLRLPLPEPPVAILLQNLPIVNVRWGGGKQPCLFAPKH